MIKVTYLTVSASAKKPEKTLIRIFPGKYFCTYDVPGKAESTVKKMKDDGRTDVLYSRGQLIQIFPKKTEEEILDIVRKDIRAGVNAAEEKTKKKIAIKDLVVERK